MKRHRELGHATVALMKAIRDGHRFGLEIMGATNLPSGTVYPTLSRLERRGYVSAKWESMRTATQEGRPRRRYYDLTADGSAALDLALERFGMLLNQPAPSEQT